MRENLKKARKEAGMTQKQVAEYLKVSERHYIYIDMSGEYNIPKYEDIANMIKEHIKEINNNTSGI